MMTEPPRTTEFFEILARVLLRCWIFGSLLLLLWFGLYASAGEAIYRMHDSLYGLSKHEMDVIFYSGMVLLKLCVLMFFFFPWLAIRLVLRKRN
jgi:hypothetical protein